MDRVYDMNLMQTSINKLIEARESLLTVLGKINTIDTTENAKQAGAHVAALRERIEMNRARLENELRMINAAIEALETKKSRMNNV